MGAVSTIATYVTGAQVDAGPEIKAEKKSNNLFVEKVPIQANSEFSYADVEYQKNFDLFEKQEKFFVALLEKSTNLEKQL